MPTDLAAASSRVTSSTDLILRNGNAAGAVPAAEPLAEPLAAIPRNGCSRSFDPAAAPISSAAPASSNTTPSVFHSLRQPDAPSARRSSAPRYTAQAIARKPASSMIHVPSRMRDSIQIAKARKLTPNTALTASIHAPARGSNLPALAPNTTSGAPIPKASANRAKPPSTASCFCAMYKTATASGGVTQGPTISADSAPMIITPASEPPDCLLLTLAIFACQELGSCSS